MLDGFYQSVICFYMTYLLYAPANSVTAHGRDLNDRTRMGVFVACSAVVASNTYVLLNTYRWDWLTVLINVISSLLIWLCTGIYSSVIASGQFYYGAAEVFGTLNFWALTFLTVTLCLAPRFAIKSFQKIYMPRDVDIIREQVIIGKFKYLDNYEAYVPPTAGNMSATSSDLIKPIDKSASRQNNMPEDERPIYPPSVAPTATTRAHRSQNGSDGTDYATSLDFRHAPQQSVDRGGPTSFERARASMDQLRPSFEQNDNFTSAAMLARHEQGGASRPSSPQNGLILHSEERHPSNHR